MPRSLLRGNSLSPAKVAENAPSLRALLYRGGKDTECLSSIYISREREGSSQDLDIKTPQMPSKAIIVEVSTNNAKGRGFQQGGRHVGSTAMEPRSYTVGPTSITSSGMMGSSMSPITANRTKNFLHLLDGRGITACNCRLRSGAGRVECSENRSRSLAECK